MVGNAMAKLKQFFFSIQFKALFRVDINHTYNTSSNETKRQTMAHETLYRLSNTKNQGELTRPGSISSFCSTTSVVLLVINYVRGKICD